MVLYFITGNEHKFEELKMTIPDLERIEMDLVEIQSLDPKEIIEHKLKEAQKHHDGEFIVEDTSLYLDALYGLPGPLIKWHLQKLGPKGLFNLCRVLENDRAVARTFIGYANGETVEFFEGEVYGRITSPSRGTRFGWDPIFTPDGHEKCFGDMKPEEKNEVSMRRKAAEKLKAFLSKR